ncbi:DNA-binding transcriptional repressor PurR [compost metagenome]
MDNQVLLDTNFWLLDLETSYWNLTDTEILEEDFQKIYRKLAEKEGITCFFALDYLSAQILWHALNKLGKKIPEDYSLLGFDGPFQDFLSPSFSRVIQNEKEIGTNATDLLIQLIDSKQFDAKEVIVDTRFLDNQSIRSINREMILPSMQNSIE